MILNLLGMQTFVGLNGALETLVPQAVNKDGEAGFDKQAIKTLLNRGRIILIIAFIPMFLIFAFSRVILIQLKQDEEVATYAQKYLLCVAPSALLWGLFDCQRRCLNCLGHNTIPMIG